MTLEEFSEKLGAKTYGEEAGLWLSMMQGRINSQVSPSDFINAWSGMSDDARSIMVKVACQDYKLCRAYDDADKELDGTRKKLMDLQIQQAADNSREHLNIRMTDMHNQRMRDIVLNDRRASLAKLREIENEVMDRAVEDYFNCNSDSLQVRAYTAVVLHSAIDRLNADWPCIEDLSVEEKTTVSKQ